MRSHFLAGRGTAQRTGQPGLHSALIVRKTTDTSQGIQVTFDMSSRSTAAKASDPGVAYAGAPGIIGEIGWVARQASGHRLSSELGREFWLRKAAVLDRIALQEVATYATEVAASAVETAELAALRLIEYDTARRGLSTRGADLSAGLEHREYVREEYRAWSLTQHI